VIETIWTALDVLAAKTSALDGRTLDQRRFDALGQLCAEALAQGSRPPARPGARACVYVYADAATWAGLADGPVELAGYGPIPAGMARQYFQDATWRAVVTDTITGQATAVSDRTYTPSARTQRHLHARDRTCGFPGCTAAIWFCDADHNTPHACGGATDTENCGLFCRRHHRLKTFTDWTWQRLPDGTLQWTDPHGKVWHRDPIRYAMPDPEPRPRTERRAQPLAVVIPLRRGAPDETPAPF
jgi:hypothetical protein